MFENILLRGGMLIDGTGAPPILNGAVQFEGGKIVAVGAANEFGESGFQGSDVVDVQGQTILPGLVNCHDHLDNRYGTDTFQARVAQPRAFSMARAARNGLIALQEGVTTIRYIDYCDINSVALKQAVEDGLLLGPRIVSCGPPIAMTGGHGWQACIEADGVDAVRAAARYFIKEGVDVVKCMASGGFVSRGQDEPWSPQLTVDEMRAAFDEAHKAGKQTTVHAHPPKAIDWAVQAGVDCIEHGALMDQQTAELLASRGIWLVPTLGEGWMVAHYGGELGQPTWLIEKCQEKLEERMRRFGYAVEAGVKMALGTDVWPSVAREMQLMTEGGLSPMDVLVAATCHGAQACGLGDQTGTLEVGKWADVIVLDGNPLDDMATLSRVKMVFKQGVLYRPETLAAATGRYPL